VKKRRYLFLALLAPCSVWVTWSVWATLPRRERVGELETFVAETKQELVEAVRELADLRKAQDRERARHQEVRKCSTCLH
jgi:hypothetical protein